MTIIMTAEELSQFLKIPEPTIHKLADNGCLPGFKIGDSWRFDFDEVVEFIKQSKETAVEKGASRKEVNEK